MNSVEEIKLKERFKIDATNHGKAILAGEYKIANKLHKSLTAVYRKANELQLADIFSNFFDEKNESVRLWAATFSLRSNTAEAEKTLEKLAESPLIFALSAKTTLQLWKQGKLELL